MGNTCNSATERNCNKKATDGDAQQNGPKTLRGVYVLGHCRHALEQCHKAINVSVVTWDVPHS